MALICNNKSYMKSPPPSPAGPFAAADTSAYAERARRQVPGYDDLHRMAGLLLGERAPTTARMI